MTNASNPAVDNDARLSTPPESLQQAIMQNGSGGQAFLTTIQDTQTRATAADVADAAHFLCLLHGRYPGLIDYAATRSANPLVGKWLTQACDAFGAERAFLTKLTVQAGPITSTAGQDQCAPAIINLRSALNSLSQSDRHGCAIGSAFALAIDWHAIRPMLEHIARRVGMEYRACTLPSCDETYALANTLNTDRLIERAVIFGASQMLQQHRLFWDMLSARRDSRNAQNGLG